MKLDNKNLQIEALFYKGTPSVKIAKIVKLSTPSVSNIIDAIIEKNKTTKPDKLEQIGCIEAELFRKIDQYNLFPTESLKKKIDEMSIIYCMFVALN